MSLAALIVSIVCFILIILFGLALDRLRKDLLGLAEALTKVAKNESMNVQNITDLCEIINTISASNVGLSVLIKNLYSLSNIPLGDPKCTGSVEDIIKDTVDKIGQKQQEIIDKPKGLVLNDIIDKDWEKKHKK
jgi:hypothetical protein